jgi:hypothetical protein
MVMQWIARELLFCMNAELRLSRAKIESDSKVVGMKMEVV